MCDRFLHTQVRLLSHPRFAFARVFQDDLPGLSLAEYQVNVSGEGGSGSPAPAPTQVKRCGELRLVSLLQHLRALMLGSMSQHSKPSLSCEL